MSIDRRTLIRSACGGCAAMALAACGGSSGGSSGADSNSAAPTTGTSEPPASSTPAAAAGPIAQLSDIPVGGSAKAKTAEGKSLLISRPDANTVVAFSATCTHQGCTVEPAGKKLACPCHGSTYDAFTGKVLGGPAPAPLHAFAVKVQGTGIVAA